MRRALWVAALGVVACGDKEPEETGDPVDTHPEFTDESVLKDVGFDTCDRAVYWPPSLFPVLVQGLEAPEPPYLITEIGGELFQGEGAFSGRDCAFDHGLHVLVYVSEDTPDTIEDDGSGRPAFEPIAEVTLVAPASDESWSYASIALDEPVRVETAGTLWIGFDDANEASVGPGACMAGCQAGTSPVYQWITEWGEETSTDSLPLFTVTVRH